jgi:hypothetical protein
VWESAKTVEDAVEYWKTELPLRHLEGCKSKNMFNSDETGIFFNLLSQKLLSVRGKGGNKCKENIAVLLCTNMDGSEKVASQSGGTVCQAKVF